MDGRASVERGWRDLLRIARCVFGTVEEQRLIGAGGVSGRVWVGRGRET